MAILRGKARICMGSSWKVRHPLESIVRTFLKQVQDIICPLFTVSQHSLTLVFTFPAFLKFKYQDVCPM